MKEFKRGIISEFRKITWPTKKELIMDGKVAILSVIGLTFAIFCVDSLFGTMVMQILKIFQTI